jgi:acetoacetate decarboxylase
MKPFFSSSLRPGKILSHGVATFECPVLYFRDDAFALFYTADMHAVEALMPAKSLHPVRLPGNRALVGVVAFNYLETSIGPYGEVGIIVPVVYGQKPPPLLLPALLEGRYPGFGSLVIHLPVTNQTARDAGRGEWGYPKFVADMRFTITPEALTCDLSEGGRHILTLHVVRQGFSLRDKKPLTTFSVRNRNLIETVIPNKGCFRMAVNPQGSYLKLGNHEVAHGIADLGLAKKPLLSRYYVERNAILPQGQVIEENVLPLDGYTGKNGKGRYETIYFPDGIL